MISMSFTNNNIIMFFNVVYEAKLARVETTIVIMYSMSAICIIILAENLCVFVYLPAI